jgi:preprotein translocase subunit SecA
VGWFQTVEQIGGLHVIGTERHESRRIDNQLRGRSGRQGDKGSSRFFVSLEDDLMKMFAGETQMKILAKLGMKEGDSIEHPWLSKSVERAQRKVEERNFQMRKNILEYDEVMEHQRQRFYGLRQRVLEGRGTKEVILDYLRDAIAKAADEYLDRDYPFACVAEYARQKLECSVAPESLRNLEAHEMEKRLKDEAKAEIRHMIDVTLGEYIPDEASEIAIDFDVQGLINWARTRFGVELTPRELEQAGATGSRRQVQRLLTEAAESRIEHAELSDMEKYLVPQYGAQQLAHWVRNKFGIEVSPEEILKAEDDRDSSAAEVLMKRAAELYRRREIEYPVEFLMDVTMLLMRQNPSYASQQLIGWANRRFGLEWTEDKLRTSAPAQVRDELIAASQQWLDSGALEKEVAAAQALKDDAALEAHLMSKFGTPLPHWMRYLEGQERLDAIRSRVESVLRSELVQFEQTILLQHLDHAWKDHLYGMDQLRDVINFRAYSQQDPRTEYKREGARQFLEMLEGVRERITDDVFRVRLVPSGMTPPQGPGPGGRPAPAPAQAPAGGGMGVMSSSISIPGLGGLGSSPPPPGGANA